MVSAELPGTGGEHLGSVTGQLEVKEDTFEEEMPEEEGGGPAEELEEVMVREENPPKTVKIGSTLAPEHKAVLQKKFFILSSRRYSPPSITNKGGDGHTIANHEAVDGGNDKDEQQEEEMDADRLE
ncbi:hypothetical protein LWI29_033563 [Acer saccharum]|uniref:Uncharacterized protein n=1 Tax=Acer saccharum TaxID=4024 RepID=A0AA39VD35_ACESA|nr:hypothetical protein LWI29_033563 [Acer saccharum]